MLLIPKDPIRVILEREGLRLIEKTPLNFKKKKSWYWEGWYH